MSKQDCVIGVYASLAEAQDAITELKSRGWSDGEVSLLTRGKESELDATGPIDQGDSMEKTAGLGAAAGAALGLLAGSTLLIVPGIGPVVLAGALASGITGAWVGGIVGAMSGWGVKEDHVQQYEGDLRNGKSILMVLGGPYRLADAKSVLESTAAERVVLHAETADSVVDE